MPDIEKLEAALEAASKPLGRAAPEGKANGFEAEYGRAYQALVKAGARPQIRAKYQGAR